VVLLGRYNAQGFGGSVETTVKTGVVNVKGEKRNLKGKERKELFLSFFPFLFFFVDCKLSVFSFRGWRSGIQCSESRRGRESREE
jgi:hypothetical protein